MANFQKVRKIGGRKHALSAQEIIFLLYISKSIHWTPIPHAVLGYEGQNHETLVDVPSDKNGSKPELTKNFRQV